MMKSIGLMSLMVILVAVFGGFWVYNATMPKTAEDNLILEPSNSFGDSQFLQLKPDSVPPVVNFKEEKQEDELMDERNDDQGSDAVGVGQVTEQVAGAEDVVHESGGENVTEISEQGVIVSMTDLGFVPSSVTVEAGTEVSFVNDGQYLHWPASDVHPTHSLLPDFDAGKGISTGGAYSYKFAKEGDWSFHDHLNPDFRGTIIVK